MTSALQRKSCRLLTKRSHINVRARTYEAAGEFLGGKLAGDGKVPSRRELEQLLAELGLPRLRWTQEKLLSDTVREVIVARRSDAD